MRVVAEEADLVHGGQLELGSVAVDLEIVVTKQRDLGLIPCVTEMANSFIENSVPAL